MAKNKGNNNNIAKAKLKKKKGLNVFKTKASARSKQVGKVVSTTLKKNLLQSSQVEKTNKSFEKAQEVILMGKNTKHKEKQNKKSTNFRLIKQNQTDNVSRTEINATANLLNNLWHCSLFMFLFVG